MIPLAVPNVGSREAEFLAECIRSTFVSSVGPFVERFERMVAEAAGAPFAVATSAGTTGLHAALLAVGVEPGDLVICPTLTFIATANAIAHAGAVPWLMDVSADSWTLGAELLADALRRETHRNGGGIVHAATGRRVRAVLPVYALGLPADMDPIVDVARTYGLATVADAAAGLGAIYKGRKSGDLGADLTMYSFNGNKTVTCGGGGAVTGGNAELVKTLRHLTTTARLGSEYLHDRVGYNYRMTNVEAAIGCAQMERLDEFVAAKRRIAARYDNAFENWPGVFPFPRPAHVKSACWFSGVLLDKRLGAKMDDVQRELRKDGVDARPFWRPMHLQPPFQSAPRTQVAVADEVWPRILTLPCSTHLTEAEQDQVITAVKRILRTLL